MQHVCCCCSCCCCLFLFRLNPKALPCFSSSSSCNERNFFPTEFHNEWMNEKTRAFLLYYSVERRPTFVQFQWVRKITKLFVSFWSVFLPFFVETTNILRFNVHRRKTTTKWLAISATFSLFPFHIFGIVCRPHPILLFRRRRRVFFFFIRWPFSERLPT